jgi:hypothetical protein
MTENEQKAREFADNAAQETDYKRSAAYEAATKMAEFKDRQFADKIKAKAKEQYNIHFGGTYSECADALTIYNFLSDFYYEITGESLE